MRIQNLYLKNFRRFKELSIDFQPDYTILIGNNGSGKSSILDAIQTMLQSFVFPVVVTLYANIPNDKSISWSYELQDKLSRKSERVNDILNWLKDIQRKITAEENVICPIIAYYSTRRQWNKTELENSTATSVIPRMNGYLHSLDAKTFNVNTMYAPYQQKKKCTRI